MTAKEFTQVATQKFSELSTDELMQLAMQLNNDFTKVGEYMFSAVLDILMNRMAAQDFIEFCNEL